MYVGPGFRFQVRIVFKRNKSKKVKPLTKVSIFSKKIQVCMDDETLRCLWTSTFIRYIFLIQNSSRLNLCQIDVQMPTTHFEGRRTIEINEEWIKQVMEDHRWNGYNMCRNHLFVFVLFSTHLTLFVWKTNINHLHQKRIKISRGIVLHNFLEDAFNCGQYRALWPDSPFSFWNEMRRKKGLI